jgi:predicted  nucleic acid-binding Zn-ribbon protein
MTYTTDYQCSDCGRYLSSSAISCPQCGARFGEYGPPLSSEAIKRIEFKQRQEAEREEERVRRRAEEARARAQQDAEVVFSYVHPVVFVEAYALPIVAYFFGNLFQLSGPAETSFNMVALVPILNWLLLFDMLSETAGPISLLGLLFFIGLSALLVFLSAGRFLAMLGIETKRRSAK